jgi:hypothetical protein
MAHENIKEKLQKMKDNPPRWAKECPKAFADYVGALVITLDGFAAEDIDEVMKGVSRAWAAGQNSVTEQQEK